MSQGRSVQTATALDDGRVLLVGGYFQDIPITSVDLYDPQTEAFTATGPMATARGFDTATRLDDGRVLIAGGNPGNWDFTGPLIASAELYDPTTGTFSLTGSMTTARDFHVATLLRDGRVLVTGGSRYGMDSASGQFLTAAEIYDPKTGTFSVTGSMKTPRASHTATLLSDGRLTGSQAAVCRKEKAGDGQGTDSIPVWKTSVGQVGSPAKTKSAKRCRASGVKVASAP